MVQKTEGETLAVQPLFRALTGQLLVAGAPRGMIVLNICLASIFLMALHIPWIVPVNLLIHLSAVYLTKKDEQFFDILRRYLHKKTYYDV
ncbi:hypothetical protein SRRS_16080 [Sporomusa rhizae]|uniref:VirB3 family type IV secretion system protein n=1 Tax=Sporomusa rhizae TaxID=357999 RepID=UPI00352A116A